MANPRDKREKRKLDYTSPKKRIQEHEKGWTPTAFRVPEGVELFKFKKDKNYRLTIVPFRAGDNNPFADSGQIHYERTYYTHPNVGPDEQVFTCLQQSFGKPCPICAQVGLMRRQGTLTDETEKALRPKERQLWLLIDHDEREKGVQLMECAHYGKGTGFGEMLDAKLDAAAEDSPYLNFFHLGTDGMTMVVKTKQDSFNGRTFFKPSNMELEPRREKDAVPETLLDEVPCLDDLPIEMDYDELNALFHGAAAPKSDDEAPAKPAAKPKTPPKAAAVATVEDEGEAELEVGCEVEFMLKGKLTKGEVTELREAEGKAVVKVEELKKSFAVKAEDLTITAPAPGDDDGDSPGDDDEAGGDGDAGDDDPAEDEPEGEEEAGDFDEEDGEGAEEAEGGDEEVTDPDEDLPFDEDDEAPVDDEPEPPKPAPKKPVAKPAAKPPAKPVPAKKPATKK